MVKDVDPKDRDYEKTLRKYQKWLEEEGLGGVITMVSQNILPVYDIRMFTT